MLQLFLSGQVFDHTAVPLLHIQTLIRTTEKLVSTSSQPRNRKTLVTVKLELRRLNELYFFFKL